MWVPQITVVKPCWHHIALQRPHCILSSDIVTNQGAQFRAGTGGPEACWENLMELMESSETALCACAAVVSGTGALWHVMGRNAEGIWGMTWITERGVNGWLEETLEGWEMWGPQRALLSSLQGLSLTEFISVEMWMGWSQGGWEEEGAVLMQWGGSVRMQCHETGSEEMNFPHRDWELLFKPVCHLCVILSEAIPPPVHQRQKHKTHQKSPWDMECAQCTYYQLLVWG